MSSIREWKSADMILIIEFDDVSFKPGESTFMTIMPSEKAI